MRIARAGPSAPLAGTGMQIRRVSPGRSFQRRAMSNLGASVGRKSACSSVAGPVQCTTSDPPHAGHPADCLAQCPPEQRPPRAFWCRPPDRPGGQHPVVRWIFNQ
ncbi:unnamed protein product [Ostreobium quekettii]|uniref:Uncharacterized protein n=1 Tax=Ostreobium quekettii TaxID=121088 RepID=A0A8S1J5R2_9CHLO|nr:unnamed protein product [Ostreobium quekettii]